MDFTFTIIAWTDTYIDIEIDFAEPLEISAGPVSDNIEIKIKNPEFFISAGSGKTIEEVILPQSTVPKQLPKGLDGDKMQK